MFGLGYQELLLILVIVLVLFGGSSPVPPAEPYVDVQSPVNGCRLAVQRDRFGRDGPCSRQGSACYGRLGLALALPLVGHQHPLLPALIDELPYVPETIQRIHGSDHRLPHRPLM